MDYSSLIDQYFFISGTEEWECKRYRDLRIFYHKEPMES